MRNNLCYRCASFHGCSTDGEGEQEQTEETERHWQNRESGRQPGHFRSASLGEMLSAFKPVLHNYSTHRTKSFVGFSMFDAMRKVGIFLLCCFAAAVIFVVAFCRLKPDGGIYWTFITYAPVVASGDGSSYQTAYRLEKGQRRYLATVEIETIRDRHWILSGGSYEDFYHKCYNTLTFTNAILNGHAYDIIAFALSDRTNAVYFDVTVYEQNGQR